MPMNTNMLIEYLQTYNEDELFYLEYHKHKLDSSGFSAYIRTLDRSYVKEHGLIVPELLPNEIPRLMMDTTYFDRESETSVYLCKHNRYTPPFLHTHVFFEILYVLSGQCTQTILQNTQLLACK